MTKPKHPSSFVYVMSDGYAVKIGVAASVRTRRKMLQGGNPRTINILFTSIPLSNLCAFSVERAAHARFDKCRAQAEWFLADAKEVILYVQYCVATHLFNPDAIEEPRRKAARIFHREYKRKIRNSS